MFLLSKLSHFNLMSWIFKPSVSLKIAIYIWVYKQIRANIQVVNFAKQKIWSQILSKNRQKFAKSPNQNICSQTLSKFARFPESGDKFASMAILAPVFEEIFAQTAFAVVSWLCQCWVNFTPLLLLSDKPGCATFQAHTCRSRKLVIDKAFALAQNRSLFLQLQPTLFQGWVYFTPLLLWFSNPGCALFEAHTWARLLVFKETFIQTVFAVVNCAVLGLSLSVFYSSVLTCNLIFLQLWLLGRSFECILHLHFKLERW